MPTTIGIIGGGQLGRMMTQAAHSLGFRVIVLDPTPHSPASQIAEKQIIGDFTHEKAIKKLAKQIDYLIFEIESANEKALSDLEKKGIFINPSPKTLSIIKDKYQQKIFLQQAKIPTVSSFPVDTKEEILKIAKKIGYPFLLKSRFEAYDGRGNFVIKKRTDINIGIKKLEKSNLYIEKFVPFSKELAVIIARDKKGKIATYPVVETTQKNNICHTCIVPANINTRIEKKARLLAKKVMNKLGGAGVFAIEMFLTKDGSVLVNEIAPRVHNSGHFTIEGCQTSQFEQHLRAITGMDLGKTSLIVPAIAMVNILGERNGKARVKGIKQALDIPGVTVHMYGKEDVKVERKMGHITAVANSSQEALRKAIKAKNFISL